MDNFKIDITCEKTKPLHDALSIIMTQHGVLRGYRIDKGKSGKPRMILFWMEDSSMTPFPFEVSRGDRPQRTGFLRDTTDRLPWLVEMIEGWLSNVEYGKQPDHDGDNGRGWRVYTEAWGHVDDNSHTACAIEPEWAWHGK